MRPQGLIFMGTSVFAAGLIGHGALSLITGELLPGLEPTPPIAMDVALLAYAAGGLIAAAAVCLLAPRTMRWGAAAVVALMLTSLAALHLPMLLAHPKNGGAWGSAFEVVAFAGSGLMLWGRGTPRPVLIGRLMFGLCQLVLGVLHFRYHDFIASMVPGFIGHGQFWAYATGVLNFAAGVAIVGGVFTRWVSLLLALMFVSWIPMVHVARVLAAPDDLNEWAMSCTALALAGGALIVAETASARPSTVAAD